MAHGCVCSVHSLVWNKLLHQHLESLLDLLVEWVRDDHTIAAIAGMQAFKKAPDRSTQC